MEHRQENIQLRNPIGRSWNHHQEDMSLRLELGVIYSENAWLEPPQTAKISGREGIQNQRESRNNSRNRRTVEIAQTNSGRKSCVKGTPETTSHTPIRSPQTSVSFFHNSLFFTIPGNFQKEARRRREENDPLQPKEKGK
ncbi:hypothetical protein O181_008681 [Austropuccinia psidii MF-1]|uniref:Uncharacterized protein n=1 Tax=Austropuccinia psidii MF-1 TaxID=1389203 RepID=A0A9Q3BQB2_9BASI|nr:hypothetical protein [Austropuccinia psidii MF-1]